MKWSEFEIRLNFIILSDISLDFSIHYNRLEDSKQLIISKLLPGMSVAVFDDNKWQRAEILCICGTDAFVLFVDAGSRKYVQVNNMRYLEKTFAVSPRKACRGTLVGVKPANGKSFWSDEEIMQFDMKTKEMKMYAVIKGCEDGFYKLSLYEDTVSRSKISSYMITQGIAEEDTTADHSINAILVNIKLFWKILVVNFFHQNFQV